MQFHSFRLALALALVLSLAWPMLPATAMQTSQGGFGQVRFLHAAPNAPPVDLWIDGFRYITGLSFGESTRYYNQWSGAREFALVPAGGDLASAVLRTTQEVGLGQAYTLMVIGLMPSLQPFWMGDDRLGTPGPWARLRFVDASPNTPALDLAIENGPVLFAGLTYGELTPYIDLPAGRTDLELRWSGTPRVAVEISNVYLTPGGVYTISTIGIAGGAPRLGTVVLYDP